MEHTDGHSHWLDIRQIRQFALPVHGDDMVGQHVSLVVKKIPAPKVAGQRNDFSHEEQAEMEAMGGSLFEAMFAAVPLGLMIQV